ncbi:MAG TPA: hypothetical protein VJP08_04645, partial [Actinomycetota bacterium]|nr:hypothetical protein [Actinomycetota bacterium]
MAERISREDFGPNTWLVEELYRQYVTDPESVSEVWRDFFEDYVPRTGDGQPLLQQARPVPHPLQPAPRIARPNPEQHPLLWQLQLPDAAGDLLR